MDHDEFFMWLAQWCIDKGYGGLTAQTVCRQAELKGLDLGSIITVGRSHLLPRGWSRLFSTGGQSIYVPPQGTVVTQDYLKKSEYRGVRYYRQVLGDDENGR